MPKHPSIAALLDRLRAELGPDSFIVVDHWEGALCAIGVAAPGDRQRLMYISTFPPEDQGFTVEREVASAAAALPYKSEGLVEVPTYALLVDALREHLLPG